MHLHKEGPTKHAPGGEKVPNKKFTEHCYGLDSEGSPKAPVFRGGALGRWPDQRVLPIHGLIHWRVRAECAVRRWGRVGWGGSHWSVTLKGVNGSLDPPFFLSASWLSQDEQLSSSQAFTPCSSCLGASWLRTETMSQNKLLLLSFVSVGCLVPEMRKWLKQTESSNFLSKYV